MSNSMFMNDTNTMKALAESLDKKINSLNEVYQDIDNKTKVLDGSNDIWKGDDQKLFYESFSLTLDKYPKNIEKLKEFHKFLVDTINEYEKRDSDINKDIDKNDDRFDV